MSLHRFAFRTAEEIVGHLLANGHGVVPERGRELTKALESRRLRHIRAAPEGTHPAPIGLPIIARDWPWVRQLARARQTGRVEGPRPRHKQ